MCKLLLCYAIMLSLYSTATQNHLHLVYRNTKICVTPKAKHKLCVTPNAKPQRKPMELRLHWVANAKFCTLCTFHMHVVCSHFISVGPIANPVCSGIWSLMCLFYFIFFLI